MRKFMCKSIVFVLMLLYVASPCKSQETSISIDNQVPGWLSSKLTYNQQLSLKELHVTGYLNGDDAIFINNLINNYSLVKLDLYGANIVDGGISKTTKKNILESTFFSIGKHMERIILPQNLDSLSFSISNLTKLDTLSIGCKRISNSAIERTVYTKGSDYENVVIDIMEGVEEIGNLAFYYNSSYGAKVQNSPINKLPSTIKTIEYNAFDQGILADTLDISKLMNLEIVGENKQVNYDYYYYAWYVGGIKIDKEGTYKFPEKLKVWNSAYRWSNGNQKRFYCYDEISADTIIVPATCDILYAELNADIAYFFSENPPASLTSEYYCYRINKLYVPKGCIDNYMIMYGISENQIHEILEMKDVESVRINENDISLLVGQQIKLSAIIQPVDAFNKKVKWESDNQDIATVDENGNVYALKSGIATIKVTTDNGGFVAECKINVIQPVVGITLNYENYTLTKLGQIVVLIPEVAPADASNKKVTWTSSNESVCIVADGKVVAVGNGVSVVTARTDDGDFVAMCIILVDTTDGITTVGDNKHSKKEFYDLKGNVYTKKQRGLNIIKSNKSNKIYKSIY